MLVVLALLCAPLFILTHSDHVHDHDGEQGRCLTCAQLCAAEHVIKLVSTGVAVGLVGLRVLLSLGAGVCPPAAFAARATTLVHMKVQMNS
ncbi:MAG: hypothetical protein LBD25_08445 [Coriobacteriales bacterium]|jgi:hypothetical protein|nr:hypothetical protein [Coriobacteriales bacterium]